MRAEHGISLLDCFRTEFETDFIGNWATGLGLVGNRNSCHIRMAHSAGENLTSIWLLHTLGRIEVAVHWRVHEVAVVHVRSNCYILHGSSHRSAWHNALHVFIRRVVLWLLLIPCLSLSEVGFVRKRISSGCSQETCLRRCAIHQMRTNLLLVSVFRRVVLLKQ